MEVTMAETAWKVPFIKTPEVPTAVWPVSFRPLMSIQPDKPMARVVAVCVTPLSRQV
jgi:hypothetical protein